MYMILGKVLSLVVKMHSLSIYSNTLDLRSKRIMRVKISFLYQKH